MQKSGHFYLGLTDKTAIIDYKVDNSGRISEASSEKWVKQYEYIDFEHAKIKKMILHIGDEQQEYIFNYDEQFRLISARYGVKNIAIEYQDKEGTTVLSLSDNHNKLTFSYENDKIIKIQLNDDTVTPISYTKAGKIVLENTEPAKVLQISAIMSGFTQITSIAQTGLKFGKIQ